MFTKTFYIGQEDLPVELKAEIETEEDDWEEYGLTRYKVQGYDYIDEILYEKSEYTEEQIKMIDEYLEAHNEDICKKFFIMLEDYREEDAA